MLLQIFLSTVQTLDFLYRIEKVAKTSIRIHDWHLSQSMVWVYLWNAWHHSLGFSDLHYSTCSCKTQPHQPMHSSMMVLNVPAGVQCCDSQPIIDKTFKFKPTSLAIECWWYLWGHANSSTVVIPFNCWSHTAGIVSMLLIILFIFRL